MGRLAGHKCTVGVVAASTAVGEVGRVPTTDVPGEAPVVPGGMAGSHFVGATRRAFFVTLKDARRLLEPVAPVAARFFLLLVRPLATAGCSGHLRTVWPGARQRLHTRIGASYTPNVVLLGRLRMRRGRVEDGMAVFVGWADAAAVGVCTVAKKLLLLASRVFSSFCFDKRQ